jgi:NADPH-dependent 2,4-dienoyl-CoA reductase/sulfur reductase-like enzyme
MHNIVVVGAGAAGLAAVETLRREGFGGALTLVGDEPAPPYDRPPLSKQILAGTWDFDRASLRPRDHYARLDVELRTRCRATGLDQPGRTVWLGAGERLGFDGLIIATGVTPRRLPFGHDLDRVHVLRGDRDAARLRAALGASARVVVIGAGFLGMEVAAVARGMGLDVMVVDPLPAPMVRQFGAAVGARIAELHRGHGVVLHTGVSLTDLRHTGGRVAGVLLSDGSVHDTDCVLVAIGAAPDVGWLRSSDITLGDGIECDEYCQAGPAVYAAGDVASWPSRRYRRRMRLEHRMNATEQGTAAARNLLHGNVEAFDPVPYFWSDQFDVKMQAHGVFPAGAELAVADGSLADSRFVVLYQEAGRTVGVLGWNSPKQVREYRSRLLDDATPVDDPTPDSAPGGRHD